MSTTQNRIAKLEAQLKEAKAKAEAANKSRIDKLRAMHTSLVGQINTLSDRITALDARRDVLFDKVDVVLAELDQLKRDQDVSGN